MTLGYGQSLQTDTLVNERIHRDTVVNSTQHYTEQRFADKPIRYFEYSQFGTFSLSAFINTTPGLQGGYEYLLIDRLSVAGELGLLYFQQQGIQPRYGVRLKGDLRYYIRPKFFLALEIVYKRTVSQVRDWVDVGTHQQLLTYRGKRRFIYGGPKLGFVLPLDRDRRFYLEIATTVGIGEYQVSNGLPPQFSLIDRRGFFWDNSYRSRTEIYPIMTTSIKIKYNFGKRE